MRTELVVPAVLASVGVSYYMVYYALSIRSSTTKWMTTVGMSVGLFVLSLFIITGGIRPFYAAFVLMVLYIIVQRVQTVKQPLQTAGNEL